MKYLDCNVFRSALSDRQTGRAGPIKWPKRGIFVAELSRNTMGKVQKTVLRETYKELFAPRSR